MGPTVILYLKSISRIAMQHFPVSAAEVEFAAEDELVMIVPSFEEERMELISGSFGPFYPQAPVEVPLWMAVELRKQNRCQIQCPPWMEVDRLKQIRQREKDSRLGQLQVVPWHYMEVANILLRVAASDILRVHEVRSVLEDIENIRQNRIRAGLQQISTVAAEQPIEFLKLNNASAMEMNSIRDFLLSTLFEIHKLYDDGLAAMEVADDIYAKINAEDGLEEEEEQSNFLRSSGATRNIRTRRTQVIANSQGSSQPFQRESQSDPDSDLDEDLLKDEPSKTHSSQ